MNPPLEEDLNFPNWQGWPGAVLLSNEIERFCNASPPLIDPFDPDNLKPARYQLTLGATAILGGQTITVQPDKPLEIPPHQVAIVRTYEILNLPRYLIARWNLTVGMVYKGLLWVGALQVDPGWTSYLPCPLYNMSDETVTIRFRERLFTIDFVRTTPFLPESKPYVMPFKEHPPLNFYSVGLRSGPYELIGKVNNMEGEVRQLESRIGINLGLLIALVTLVVAALAALLGVSVKNAKGFDLPAITTGDVAVIIAAVALTAALAPWIGRVLLKPRANKGRSERSKG